jgi:hypothetical protein
MPYPKPAPFIPRRMYDTPSGTPVWGVFDTVKCEFVCVGYYRYADAKKKAKELANAYFFAT